MKNHNALIFDIDGTLWNACAASAIVTYSLHITLTILDEKGKQDRSRKENNWRGNSIQELISYGMQK
jgi:phosphoglycolate phosphatase-like HAD superfamily hydrolase